VGVVKPEKNRELSDGVRKENVRAGHATTSGEKLSDECKERTDFEIATR